MTYYASNRYEAFENTSHEKLRVFLKFRGSKIDYRIAPDP